MNADEHR